MTQPSFVPIGEADQVRPSLRLETPRRWTGTRPAELTFPVRPGGLGQGTPGPDQGFALRLAKRFTDRLRLAPGESAEDVVVGCALLAARRSAFFGRAPCVRDLDAAFAVWGFLDEATPELVDARRWAFTGAAHEEGVQRALVGSVDEAVLRLSADEVIARRSAGGLAELIGAARPA